MFINSSLSVVSFGASVVFWVDCWLYRKDIGVVVAFDLVDNRLELAFIDFINNVTNKRIKYVNINIQWLSIIVDPTATLYVSLKLFRVLIIAFWLLWGGCIGKIQLK